MELDAKCVRAISTFSVYCQEKKKRPAFLRTPAATAGEKTDGRRDVPATALGNHLCGAPVAEGRRRPDRQTDPRWQATHLGGSGSSRAGNSLTLFIPAILVSPPSPRSFRHNRVDTLRSSRQCAPLPLLLLFRTFNQSVVKRLTT